MEILLKSAACWLESSCRVCSKLSLESSANFSFEVAFFRSKLESNFEHLELELDQKFE